jgi:hypothetical protein
MDAFDNDDDGNMADAEGRLLLDVKENGVDEVEPMTRDDDDDDVANDNDGVFCSSRFTEGSALARLPLLFVAEASVAETRYDGTNDDGVVDGVAGSRLTTGPNDDRLAA